MVSNTGVRYSRKSIYLESKGKYISGVFPDFKKWTFSRIEYPRTMLKSTDDELMVYATKKLRDIYKNDVEGLRTLLKKHNDKMFSKGIIYKRGNVKLLGDDLVNKQIKDIMNPSSSTKGRVFGFTWHHNEQEGVIDLVDDFIHKNNPHLGNKSISGGGAEYR